MSQNTHDAIEKLLRDLTTQCESSTQTLATGQGHYQNKLRLSLELSMTAAEQAASKLLQEPELPEGLRSSAQALISAQARYREVGLTVAEHMGALKSGWSCSRCKASVPARAKLTLPPVHPTLECRACGTDTPLTSEGLRAFEEIFGALIQRGWNPQVAGFVIV